MFLESVLIASFTISVTVVLLYNANSFNLNKVSLNIEMFFQCLLLPFNDYLLYKRINVREYICLIIGVPTYICHTTNWL